MSYVKDLFPQLEKYSSQ